jgi:hypothetical protein
MQSLVVRGVVAFAIVVIGIGLTASGQHYLFAAGGLIAGLVAYAVLDYLQTGRMAAVRLAVGVVVFAAALAGLLLIFGINADPTTVDPDTGANEAAANSFATLLAIAMVIGAVAYFGLEYLQTGGLGSIAGQFSTRTLVLMPVAIAINIVLGQAVGAALRMPIYLDSIGTILVGVLAGPFAGAVTGGATNLLWSYAVPPPFQSATAAAWAITAVVIGVIAGLAGRTGLMRPRPDRTTTELLAAGLVTVALIGVMAYAAVLGYETVFEVELSLENLFYEGLEWYWMVLGIVVVGVTAAAIVGLFAFLLARRDLTASYVVILGVFTGIVAAIISAPIAAGIFGGVTGAGTDVLVAAFRQAGLDVEAATQAQGLISDPIDKVVTFVVVYVILNAMARRTKARFPQGERLVGTAPSEAAS